ncbi:DUF4430 domain-containing protein [Candidatus Pacebacteria bacterium]|nr:DUF4430 domain-containing protein [Candidatus Paceibacterota bacterium]
MKQEHIKQILLLGLGVAVILAGITYTTGKNRVTPEETTQIELRNEESAQITLSIDGLYSSKTIAVEYEETILQMLEKLNETNPQLQLKSKSYGEMGVLVESMGDKTNGDNNSYWQYTVNGVAPMIGADAHIMKNDDTLKWQFKQSEF